MDSKLTYKRIWQIALPVVLGSVAQNVITLVDTIFLGNVGETELGAAAIAAIFYQTFVMLMFGFGVGTQIIIARRMGQKRGRTVGGIFQHSALFAMAAAVVIWAVFQLWGNFFLESFVQTPNIRAAAKEFLEVRSFGYGFAFLTLIFNAFYVGISRTRTISIAVAGMAIVNIILDYGLIFGKWGLPAMGMAGAALASVIAEGVGLSIYIIRSLNPMYRLRFRLFVWVQLHYSTFKRLWSISYPVMLQYFISFSNYFIFFLLIESMGERALAISNITRSLYVVFMLPIWGFTATTSSLTAYFMGAHSPEKIPILVRKCNILMILSISIIEVLYLLFYKHIIGLYTPNAELIIQSITPTFIVLIATYGMGLAQIYFHVILGLGKTRMAFGLELITLLVYLCYSAWAARIVCFPITGVWTSELVYVAVLFLLSFVYLQRIHFGKNLSKNTSL